MPGFTPLICDFNRTSVVFQAPDVYRFVGRINGFRSMLHPHNIFYSYTNRKARVFDVNPHIPHFLILSLACYSLNFTVQVG